MDNIIIVTDIGMPNGMAPSNRIITYLKGFGINNIRTEVLIFRPTNHSTNIINPNSKGKIFQFSDFLYTGFSSTRSKFFLIRRLQDIFSLILLFLILELRVIFKKKPKGIIVYTYSLIPEILIILWAKIHFIKVYKELSENPVVYFDRIRFKCYPFLYQNLVLNKYSCIIAMTTSIITYLNSKKIKKYIHVPMTVDIERFNIVNQLLPKCHTITYVGSLNEHKDGVLFLINGISEIAKKHKITLLLIGDPINTAFSKKMEDVIILNQLQLIVQLISFLPSVQIPKYLVESSLLVLPRPRNIQTEHGFPTKLGEYLASSTPVLTSNVGDIPNYLINDYNAFVYQAGNLVDFKEKLSFIIDNYSRALEVGVKGRDTALEFFNPAKNVKKIVDCFYEKN